MKIQTVLGEVDTKDLGKTLMHEHILCANWTARQSYPDWLDRAEFVDLAVRMLRRLKARGFSTLVDATPPGLGRDIDVIREVSEKAQMHIIASTGFYWYEEVWLVGKETSRMVKRLVNEVEKGIQGTTAKAGIIKRDTPLITAEDKPACLAVFAEACQKKQAPFTQIASISEPRITKEGVSFRYRQKRWQLGSRALYQCKNAACAIDVILTLREKGFLISEEQMEKGLRKAFWLGRYEILREEPLFLLDGAHNVDGIQALLHSLPKHLNLHIICSPLQDKETDQMLSLLKTLGEEVVVVHFDTPRAIHEEQIQSLPGVVWGGDYQEVIRQAWFGNAPTIVTGSLYFIADVRNYLKTLGVKMR